MTNKVKNHLKNGGEAIKKMAAKKTGRASSRSKTKKQEEKSSLGLGFCWLVTFAFCLWFLVVLFTGGGGSASGSVSKFFKYYLGYGAYVFPFVLLYCLGTILINISKPHKGLLTMTFGLTVFTASLCGIMARISVILGNPAESGSGSGGQVGYLIDSTAAHWIGGFGAALVSLLLFFAGVQLLFKIPWLSLLSSLSELIKEDYRTWAEGRQELREKLSIAAEKEKEERPYKDIEPVAETKKSRKQIEAEKSVEPESEAWKIPPASEPAPQKEKVIEKKTEPVKIVRADDGPSPYSMPQPAVQKAAPAAAGSVNIRAAKPAAKMPAGFPSDTQAADTFYKDFKLPGTDLLDSSAPGAAAGPSEQETLEAKFTLENTFKSFGIEVSVTEIHPGPVVTRYEVSPGMGVKITSITSLAEDVALAMRSGGAVRVTGHIPGKAAIGFEIPNKTRAKVSLRELLESGTFLNAKDPLTVALGRYAEGAVAVANLEKMPHLLIAGATASGKSVFMQSLILSLMFRNKPDEVKFLFIDPKRMELTFYEDIPYLYDPKCGPDQVHVITDADEAAKSLQGMVKVMYDRTKKFSEARAKNMASYNKWALENSQPQEYRIVVVVDELADLMIQQRKVVEDAIQRLAQMARAVGIHLVLATQRPSTDVITGVIKANLPSRVALKVTSSTDSRVILDQPGANSLLGYGDLLYLATDKPVPSRIQGAFVSEEEIKRVADFVKAQARPNYEPLRFDEPSASSGKGGSSKEILEAMRLVLSRKRVSQDLLKAHFGSSSRATNILSILECDGYIKKPEGSNKWAINFDKIEAHLKACENKSDNIENPDGVTEELIP